MHGTDLHIVRNPKPLEFTPDYATPEYMAIVRAANPETFDSGICTHCQNGGYLSPALYAVVGAFVWDAGDSSTFANNVCEKHLIDEMENFRDIGK